MALGLFVSAFARTEFQAVQFMPAFIFPQLLLCGLFIDAQRDGASCSYWFSWALPLTYAYEAPGDAPPAPAALGSRFAVDVVVVVGVHDRARSALGARPCGGERADGGRQACYRTRTL